MVGRRSGVGIVEDAAETLQDRTSRVLGVGKIEEVCSDLSSSREVELAAESRWCGTGAQQRGAVHEGGPPGVLAQISVLEIAAW